MMRTFSSARLGNLMSSGIKITQYSFDLNTSTVSTLLFAPTKCRNKIVKNKWTKTIQKKK